MSQFYGSSGVEVLYPSQMMNPHQFSEPEWSAPPLVRAPAHPSFTSRSGVHPSQVPLHPTEFDPKYEPAFSTSHRPPPIEVSHIPNPVIPFSRPKSSPSTFGPNVEDLLFTENPFRMKHDEYNPMFSVSPQTAASTKAASPYYPASEYPVSNASASPGRSAPVPIAPDPVGLRQMNALKRMRDDEDQYSEYGQRKRKRAVSNAGPVELNEEEQLLLKLKEEENLPWKDIAVRFQTDLGKSYQVPALQMRFKRLRERMRTWTETDVSTLTLPSSRWSAENVEARLSSGQIGQRWGL